MVSAIQWTGQGYELAAGLHPYARVAAIGDGPFGGINFPFYDGLVQPAVLVGDTSVTLNIPDVHSSKPRWVRIRLWGHINVMQRRMENGNGWSNAFAPTVSFAANWQVGAPFGLGAYQTTTADTTGAMYQMTVQTNPGLFTTPHHLWWEFRYPIFPGQTGPFTFTFQPTLRLTTFPAPAGVVNPAQLGLAFSLFAPLQAELRLFHQ